MLPFSQEAFSKYAGFASVMHGLSAKVPEEARTTAAIYRSVVGGRAGGWLTQRLDIGALLPLQTRIAWLSMPMPWLLVQASMCGLALQPPEDQVVLYGLLGGECAAANCEPFSQQWADLSPAITGRKQPASRGVHALHIP